MTADKTTTGETTTGETTTDETTTDETTTGDTGTPNREPTHGNGTTAGSTTGTAGAAPDATATGLRTASVDASVPTSLGSPRSKLVYLYLRTTGGGSARDVCDDLGMGLVAAYPVLDSLVRQDLVVRDDQQFHCC